MISAMVIIGIIVIIKFIKSFYQYKAESTSLKGHISSLEHSYSQEKKKENGLKRKKPP